jgi:hypothetical protein
MSLRCSSREMLCCLMPFLRNALLRQIIFSTATGGDFAMQPIIGSTLLSSKVAQPTKKPFEIYDNRLIGFIARARPVPSVRRRDRIFD